MVLWVTLATRSIHNESQQVASFRLPDQSRVVLDSKSAVSFRKFFWNRKLKLEGKGYFEVKKGSRFQVITSGGFVEVLGTRFLTDVSNNQMQVMCYEGKVKAAFHDNEEILPAGTGVRFTENDNKIKLTGKESYPGFALFSKEYHNENAETVMNDLEKFFGVNIVNQTDQQRYFSGSINTGNLDLALSIVTASLKLDFEHQKKNNIRIYQSVKQFNN
jgi:ferric-dicitrate binding protein FerR (iron transport regulator)